MKSVGLFSGIGGLELGMQRSGFEALLFCDIMPAAQHVLKTRFPGASVHDDVTTLKDLPEGTSLLTAGFPCQDLSQAGLTKGIDGSRSGLVGEIFRLLGSSKPATVVLENVPFMLNLHAGEPMRRIVDAFEDLGYRWAWRILDTNAFGLPQRRERVFFVASREIDPAAALLLDDVPRQRPSTDFDTYAHGFYWTEGRTGLGWAVNAIPTLKNGSTVGIPSPPAIVRMNGAVVKPHIEDAERLQGFEAGWTAPAEEVAKSYSRWTLVGNAVSVPVAAWVGQRIVSGAVGVVPPGKLQPFPSRGKLPKAAFFDGITRHAAALTTDPVNRASPMLEDFLVHGGSPLSRRATAGFLSRTDRASVRFPEGFLTRVRDHLASL